MISFADSVVLNITKNPKDLTEQETYLVNSVVREWKSSWDRITNISAAGNHRLAQYLADRSLTIQDMSYDIRNITPYGMLRP